MGVKRHYRTTVILVRVVLERILSKYPYLWFGGTVHGIWEQSMEVGIAPGCDCKNEAACSHLDGSGSRDRTGSGTGYLPQGPYHSDPLSPTGWATCC